MEFRSASGESALASSVDTPSDELPVHDATLKDHMIAGPIERSSRMTPELFLRFALTFGASSRWLIMLMPAA